MPKDVPRDPSNGYQAVAADFIAYRSSAAVGATTMREWIAALPPRAAVLDLGCGSGDPIAVAVAARGCEVFGVDASPAMIAAFRARLPAAHAECAPAEQSEFFGRRFDGVVAWGLLFLLEPAVQAQVIHKVAAALQPGGRFVFTAPRQPCEWHDSLTGKLSISLGAAAYGQMIESAGLVLTGETDDEGENHYFFVRA